MLFTALNHYSLRFIHNTPFIQANDTRGINGVQMKITM